MDSLTQIVLGAACGEAVLGKKIGNKALLFGAIGGTIPDLDVFVGRLIYSNEIDIMAFHRGLMHSFLFTITGAFIFGWLTFKIYNSGKRVHVTNKKDWFWLFFASLFTHSILDSFTPYGTQLFAPFSNYRVAFNTIAVADFAYTIPFLFCLIILMFYKRSHIRRKLWLRIGFAVSSFYIFLTIINKVYINSVYEQALKAQNIPFTKFQTQPSILNNILWYGIAETPDNYFVAFYSLLDKSSEILEWSKLPKNHKLVSQNNKDIKTLSWFSNGYFNLKNMNNGSLRYNDLRYPSFDINNPSNSVFSFSIFKDEDRYNILPFNGKAPSTQDFSYFWERIKGR